MLAARVRKLTPIVDEEHPVAFVGGALLTTIGESTDAKQASIAATFRNDVTNGWRSVAGQGLSRDHWLAVGRELQAELDGEEVAWNHYINEAINLEKRLDEHITQFGDFYRRDRGWSVFLEALAARAPAQTKPVLLRRGAAHFACLGAKLREAPRKRPTSNDWYDLRQALHIAWPAFFVTTDFTFMTFADRVCRAQRAWIRSPVELIEDRIARAVPWGTCGKAIADSFKRIPIAALRKRQDALRAGLKRGFGEEAARLIASKRG
jgi:hypothetical protein